MRTENYINIQTIIKNPRTKNVYFVIKERSFIYIFIILI